MSFLVPQATDIKACWTTVSSYISGHISSESLIANLELILQYSGKNGLGNTGIAILLNLLNSHEIVDEGSPEILKLIINCLIPCEPLLESNIDLMFCWLFNNHMKPECCSAVEHVISWIIVAIENGVIQNEYVRDNYYIHLMHILFGSQYLVRCLCHLLKKLTCASVVSVNIAERLYSMKAEVKSSDKQYISALIHKFTKYIDLPSAIRVHRKSIDFSTRSWKIHKMFSFVPGRTDLPNMEERIEECQLRITQQNINLKEYDLGPKIPKCKYVSRGPGKCISDIASVKELALTNNIRLPDFEASVLSTPMGQLYVALMPPDSPNLVRIMKQVEKALSVNSPHPGLLEALSHLQITAGTPFPPLSKFLIRYLEQWNGVENASLITSFIIPWLHFNSLKELDKTLASLFSVFSSSSFMLKMDILKALGVFYYNLVTVTLKRKCHDLMVPFTGKFPQWTEEPAKTLPGVAQMIENFVLLALAKHHESAAILLVSLTMYHEISLAEEESAVPLWTIVPAGLVMLSLTSASFPVVEKLCHLLNRYCNIMLPLFQDLNCLAEFSSEIKLYERYCKEAYFLLWNSSNDRMKNSMIYQVMLKTGNTVDFFANIFPDNGYQSIRHHRAFHIIISRLLREQSTNEQVMLTDEELEDIIKKFAPETIEFIRNMKYLLD